MPKPEITIYLKEDPDWIKKLEQKKEGYQQKIENQSFQGNNLELRNTLHEYALYIISILLKDRSVSSDVIFTILTKKQKDNFNEKNFYDAFTLIDVFASNKGILEATLNIKKK